MASRITLLAIRVRSRFAKESWQMLRIMIGFALVLGMFAVAQVVVCKREHPGKRWQACLLRR
jgi:hypothetical protein